MHRVAISNHRIRNVSNGRVSFQWKNYRAGNKQKQWLMTLAAGEFIRRFLIHTLPAGFQRIRYFGLLANRFRKEKLAVCRQLLNGPMYDLPPETAGIEIASFHRCPQCRTGVLIRIAGLPAYRWAARAPDTS